MKNTKTLTRVALLVAIELVMKMVGLGSVPVGPLYMSFLTLPIAVGAITMGPAVGALLGGVFGAVSFYDAITGASAMTGALFQGESCEHLYPVRGYARAHGPVLRPDLQRPEAL